MALTQISTAGVKDDAVTAGKIPANAVGSSEIAANAVGSSELADNAVDNAAVASNAAIAGTKISPNFGSQAISSGDLTITSGAPFVSFVDSDHNSDFNIQINAGALNFNDTTNSATRMSIDSSGNLCIGTTSGDKRLTLVDRTDPIALIIGENDNATTDAGLRIQARNTANSSGFNLDIAVDADAPAATFDFGGAERMRLDSSGNLQLRNATTSHQAIQFYKDNNLGCSFSYGEGTANPTLNIYRQDAQSGFPYGNLIINTGDGTNPTQALKLRTDKNIELAGNLIMASGKGIDFSATSDGSGVDSSELFDDYEEGTWTPTITGGTLNTTSAHYTKVGRVVHWYLYATITNTANNSTQFRIYGLPYTVLNGSFYGGGASINYTGTADNSGLKNMAVLTHNAQTYIYFHFIGAGDSNAPVNSYFHSHLLNQGFIIAGSYFV